MIRILLTASFIFLLLSLKAQQYPFSDAYNEIQKQRLMYELPLEYWDSVRCEWFDECASEIQPLSGTCPLNKRMFGWYAAGTSIASYQWESISDLSFFSYDVNPNTGNAYNASIIESWATAPAVITAKENGIKVNLCVTLFNNSVEFATFFGSASAQATLINNLVNAVVEAEADGINIDFEGSGLNTTYLTPFTSFIESLSVALHDALPEAELSVDIMASYSNASTMLSLLDHSVDLFILMSYDYYWGSQGLPGPVAPLYDFHSSPYSNVSNDLNNFLKVVNPQKLLLGLPYYGRRWGASNMCELPGIATGSSAISVQTYGQYLDNVNAYYSYPNRDSMTFSAYSCFEDLDGITNQQFIDDEYSMQKKYDLMHQRNLAGVAVWRLGYEGAYSDLWDLIQANLSTCPSLKCSDTLYDMGGPFRNYHNSERYQYTIQSDMDAAIQLSFLEFDLEEGMDFLKIYDGSDTMAPLLATLTGSDMPPIFTSSGSKMTLSFFSNGSTTKPGYKAIYNCLTSSVPDVQNVEWNVSPNPFIAEIVISGQNIEKGNYKFSITNVLGQNLWSDSVDINQNSFTIKIDVSKFAAGVYFMNIANQSGAQFYKIVKI